MLEQGYKVKRFGRRNYQSCVYRSRKYSIRQRLVCYGALSNCFKTAKKWIEQKEKIDAIEKPIVPEVLNGCTWNQKNYGKAGNYSIYPNGNKTLITDDQAEEIKNYLELREEYKKKVEEIKNA